MKRCPRCKETKSLVSFSKNQGRCKSCNAELWADYYKKNKPVLKKKQKAFRDKHPEKRRAKTLATYSLSANEYKQLHSAQGGVCAVCSNPCKTGTNLAIDHEHSTGRVRGLLCRGCNIGIGFLQENPESLRNAATYLEWGGLTA